MELAFVPNLPYPLLYSTWEGSETNETPSTSQSAMSEESLPVDVRLPSSSMRFMSETFSSMFPIKIVMGEVFGFAVVYVVFKAIFSRGGMTTRMRHNFLFSIRTKIIRYERRLNLLLFRVFFLWCLF